MHCLHSKVNNHGKKKKKDKKKKKCKIQNWESQNVDPLVIIVYLPAINVKRNGGKEISHYCFNMEQIFWDIQIKKNVDDLDRMEGLLERIN